MGAVDKEIALMDLAIVIEKGEDVGDVVHCPGIPGCHSQGETLDDAIHGCLEALSDMRPSE